MDDKSLGAKRKTVSKRAKDRIYFVSSLNAQKNPCQCAAVDGGDMGVQISFYVAI